MQRYRIEGFRPGSQLHTPFGWVKTAGDGAARLSPKQKKNLEERGYELTPVVDPEPDEPAEEISWEERHRREVEARTAKDHEDAQIDADRRAAAQAQAADAIATGANSAPSKSDAAKSK